MTASPPTRSRSEIHDKVLELVSTLGPGKGRTALDAPLGPGHMALQLERAGYQVSGADMELRQSEKLPASIVRRECNLNLKLPFDDAGFDLITSLEGIEHVENHFQMARELGRVTKPGGHLIVSTPNICNLEERLNFLVRGSFYRFITREAMLEHGSGYDHQNLIGYVELRQVLDWAGFRVLRAERDRAKWKQNVFFSPLWLLIKGYLALQTAKRRGKYLLDETASNPVLLGGNTIILPAQKT